MSAWYIKHSLKVSNKNDSLQGESLKQEALTYLSKMTAEVVWPSSRSLLTTEISPFLLSPSTPPAGGVTLSACLPLKMFPCSLNFPPGSREANYLRRELMILESGLSSSCHVDYSDKRHLHHRLSKSHRVKDYKVCWMWDVGVGVCLRSRIKWWCTKTLVYDLTVERRGARSAFWLCSCLILVTADATQCTFSFVTPPSAFKGPFMYHLAHKHTHTHIQRGMHNYAYHIQKQRFMVLNTHNSFPAQTSGGWCRHESVQMRGRNKHESHHIKNSFDSFWNK